MQGALKKKTDGPRRGSSEAKKVPGLVTPSTGDPGSRSVFVSDFVLKAEFFSSPYRETPKNVLKKSQKIFGVGWFLQS
jgi:hypothetical protein